MKNRWFAIFLILSLAITLLFTLIVFLEPGSAREPVQPSWGMMLNAAPVRSVLLSPLSVADSSVTTTDCYNSGETRTLCFTINNGSTDGEWLDLVRLTFPAAMGGWSASCNYQDQTDSSGYPVNLTCNISSPNEVRYEDHDDESPNIGEISNGTSWQVCVDVTVPGGFTGPRQIHWEVSGDENGTSAPHEVFGQFEIEQCRPLMLEPLLLEVEGCNGITQTHTIDLWNNTGNSGTVDLSYEVLTDNATFIGPESFTMSDEEVVTFTVSLAPSVFLQPGESVTATLHVQGLGFADDAVITQQITDFAGWASKKNTTIPSMDSVVIWASHADGGLWAIGGYGSNGATQRYDPGADSWSVHASEVMITPTIEYPMDGCYGLNDLGEEIVVLFPDTLVTDTLHIYNIAQDNWSAAPVPGGYPVEGRWGHDIVSLLNFPGDIPGVDKNVCYLTGGSTQEGGGRTRDMWEYHPASNTSGYLGNFPADVWFNFHASWYVPWVGNRGAICVAGGVDHNHQINDTTQCYDLDTGSFNGLNADLGFLPEPWWGMADGWQTYDGRYQIWVANGVSQNGLLLPATAYADDTTGGFVSGPDLPLGLYRLEGDGVDGQFFTVQGAKGGFDYSTINQLLVQCPTCYPGFLPIIRRE